MKKIGHKLLATMMTLTFLTVTVVPAFAETTAVPPSQVEKSDKVKLTPQEVLARLRARIQKIQTGGEDMAKILTLRTQEKDIRSNIRVAGKSIHQGLKVARENKDKATLLLALDSLVKAQEQVIVVKGTATILKDDYARLKTDRKANAAAVIIAEDLSRIEMTLGRLIDQQTQLLAALNNTIAILSNPTLQKNASPSNQVQ